MNKEGRKEMEQIPVKIRTLDRNVVIPQYQSKEAAGFDVRWFDPYLNQIIILPGVQEILRTGLEFCLPKGYELQIRPRSGLSAKHALSITNSPGTLDSDYRDELKILLINLGKNAVEIERGDRIAQCVLAPIYQAVFEEVEYFSDEDMERDRGGGFGSTGIK